MTPYGGRTQAAPSTIGTSMTNSNYLTCDCGKRYNAAKYSRCYRCNQRERNRRLNGCVECGSLNCNGLCLDIHLETVRGVRDPW